ncbi:MAG TPA: hypothetical protein VHL54_04265, partial [Actinomycetota bacterium]|nr:hypothetical protein [Actinomycetota bacterium]
EALDREGFEIPFPQRTIWLRTEPATMAAPIPFQQVAGRGSASRRPPAQAESGPEPASKAADHGPKAS